MLLPRFSVPNINTRIDYDSQNKFHLDIYIYYFVTRLKLLHKREVKVFLAFPCLGYDVLSGRKQPVPKLTRGKSTVALILMCSTGELPFEMKQAVGCPF